MNLDINTPRGQKSLRDEQVMLNSIAKKYGSQVYQTPKEREAKCDGIIARNGEIRGIFESKCRYNLYYDFNTGKLDVEGKNGFRPCDSWLITYEKIELGAYLSKLLCVPFIGFLYIVNSGVVLTWKITDDVGNIIIDTNEAVTATQYSINGGTAVRKNAYLKLTDSKLLIKPNELVL